ncbi:MAG: hypothetical protein AAF653_17610 [Chloroflexota bacterium]
MTQQNAVSTESVGGTQTPKSSADFIFYRPDFERLTGCVKSALLLERIRFLFLNVKGGNEFYKFDAPCSHPKCNKNDTWADELNASRHQIGRLRRKIATEVKSGDSKTDLMQVEDEQGNLHPVNRIVLYWRDSYRKTTYWLNTELLKRHLSRIGSQLPQVSASESHMAGSETAHAMSQDRTYHVAESHMAGSKTAHAMSQDRTFIDTESPSESPSESPTQSPTQQQHPRTQQHVVDVDETLSDSGIHVVDVDQQPASAARKEAAPDAPFNFAARLPEILLRFIGVDEPQCHQYNHISAADIRRYYIKAGWLEQKGLLRNDAAAFVMGKLKASAEPSPPNSALPPSHDWEPYYQWAKIYLQRGAISDPWISVRKFLGQQPDVKPEQATQFQWVPARKQAPEDAPSDAQGAYWLDALDTISPAHDKEEIRF